MEAFLRKMEREVRIRVGEEPGVNFQASLNSWGHLALRWFKEDEDGEVRNDTLIVLSAAETSHLIAFLKRLGVSWI